MKSPLVFIASLAAGFVMACGAPESTAPESSSSPSGTVAEASLCGDGICCDGETRSSCPQDCTERHEVPWCYISPTLYPIASSSEASAPRPEVSAQGRVMLTRPRDTTYLASFPLQVDGEGGGCETQDDCTTT